MKTISQNINFNFFNTFLVSWLTNCAFCTINNVERGRNWNRLDKEIYNCMSRLVCWPRKKQTKALTGTNSYAMAA